jgi:transcriptional/translational regulatory protein YebC/TACO1
MMKEGSAKQAFTERGIIIVAKKDKSGKIIDKDRAEDIAIEVGAEEVSDADQEDADEQPAEAGQQDENGQATTWTFYTMARDTTAVKLRLEKLGEVEVISAETKFLPMVRVPINKDDFETAVTLIEKMQELEEVSGYYDNIKEADR